MEGSQVTAVGVRVGGSGEGVSVGGRGVDVGDGMNMVDVIVGMRAGVGAWVQEARMISKSKKNFFIPDLRKGIPCPAALCSSKPCQAWTC